METVKDLYRVLNISSSASTEAIKKAYRKLALQYHPDKHNNSADATQRFTELNEAHYILSDRKRRAAYHYKRYLQDPLYANRPAIHSAEDVLLLSRKLYKEINASDPFRIDRDLLYCQLQELLSADHLSLLTNKKDVVINREIVHQVTAAFRHLSMDHITIIAAKLTIANSSNAIILTDIQQSVKQAKQVYYWNRYKILIALLAALLFCFLLYLSKG